jgi:monoamine oxidase
MSKAENVNPLFWSRRGALALLGQIAATLPVAACASTPKRRFIVVGAGISGLAAARLIADSGHEVIVLEARNRIGGRLHTSRIWPDMPVDLGASWIHGADLNPVKALADEAGVRTVATSYDRSLLHIDPSLAATGIKDLDSAWAERLVSRAISWADRQDSDVSVAAALDAVVSGDDLSPGRQAQLAHYLAGTYEQEYAGPLNRLSAWHIDEAKEFGGPDLVFPTGYDRLAIYLSRGLDIRTGHEVSEIVRTGKTVLTTCRNRTQFSADRIIVTVPLGVLKSGAIRFKPGLTEDKIRAVDRLGMGLLNKHFLRFERPFWPPDVDWHELIKPDPGKWSQWVSFTHALGKPVLLGLSGADAAQEVEEMVDRDVADATWAAVRRMFGSNVPAPEAIQITRWRRDPFSRGSYSFTAVGSSSEDRRALARPEDGGVLILAGEACNEDYPGTVHGALLSGRAAATTLLRLD